MENLIRAQCPKCGRTKFYITPIGVVACQYDDETIAEITAGDLFTATRPPKFGRSDEYDNNKTPGRVRCPVCGCDTFLIREASGRIECRFCVRTFSTITK